MTGSKQEPTLPKHKHEAYTHRDVASLPPAFTQWAESFEKIQKAHNRILQQGFMHRDVDAVLADAKAAGVEWLTNICCPSAKADIMLHISKEMVVNYQVGETELNTKAHAVYASLVDGDEASLLMVIDTTVNLKMEEIIAKESAQIEKAAREMLIKNFKNQDNGPDKEKGLKNDDITVEQLEAAKRIVLDMERRKVMDAMVPVMVKDHLTAKAGALGLVKKTLHDVETRKDFFYGGPAGSGKSTLSKQDLSDDGLELGKINKKDCVTIATDVYRAFTLPGTDDHERIKTKDVFTRTQDFAYMVKEQVLKEMTAMGDVRPNLINDGVTVEYQVRGMLAKTKPENLVSKVALYRGDEAGYRGIAERALSRAQDEDAVPADKGRYIETTSLFSGHAEASQLFLANLPAKAVTEVFDTNVDRGSKEHPVRPAEDPVKVAIVNSSNNTVEILNLRVMSEWLNKKNLNIQAEHPVELILRKRKNSEDSSLHVTAPENKAAAIIDLAMGLKIQEKWVDVPPYTVTLKNAKGQVYASILPGGKLRVEDLSLFTEMASRKSSPEAEVLRAITRQTQEATAAPSGSDEAKALKLVEVVDESFASSHESAIETRIRMAHLAARERFIKGHPELAMQEFITAALEGRLDLREWEGPALAALEAVFEQNVEFELELRQEMMQVARMEEQERAVTPKSIGSLEGIRVLYLDASVALQKTLDKLFKPHMSDGVLVLTEAASQLIAHTIKTKSFKEHHPDKGGDENDFKRLHDIYELLKDYKATQEEGLALGQETQETLSITTESQQPIPRGLDPEKADKVDESPEIAVEVVAARVISAAIASPKIITGNYSALMACLNDILTNTVAIASDGDKPSTTHIHLIAEPMWLDDVDRSYDNELWGQSIDAFPPAVQKFAKQHIEPSPKDGEKLTWAQVRTLRTLMLERIREDKGFTVYEGQIKKVKEQARADAEDDSEKELQIEFLGQEQPVTIPFTGQPVVLDLSQRPRPAGPVLTGEPTVLYSHSREKNTTTLKDVPIIVSGSGAQAAWVLDKMGTDRSYHISYRGTLDFRIANAVLGQNRYTASDALIDVKSRPLCDALEPLAKGALTPVHYKKDDGSVVTLNISVFPGSNVKLLKAEDIPEDVDEARAVLQRLGIKPEDVDMVHAQISLQMRARREKELTEEQLAIQLFTDPWRVEVGFAVNATGWVPLKETVAREATPFWGPSARVSTGEELVRAANSITTGSLLPGSGLHRSLAIKDELRSMRTETEMNHTYDVRELAFTKVGFNIMCDECQFPLEFNIELENAIKRLATPAEAMPNPVAWIVSEYERWLDTNPQVVKKEALVALARDALDNNVAQNVAVESSELAEKPKEEVVEGFVLPERARDLHTFFGGGASSRIDSRLAEIMKVENFTLLAKQADEVGYPVEKRRAIIQSLKDNLSQEQLMEIKSKSETAQEAWDQQYGLVPRN
jgi:hypothetical protein